jgi:hypothetical protein
LLVWTPLGMKLVGTYHSGDANTLAMGMTRELLCTIAVRR